MGGLPDVNVTAGRANDVVVLELSYPNRALFEWNFKDRVRELLTERYEQSRDRDRSPPSPCLLIVKASEVGSPLAHAIMGFQMDKLGADGQLACVAEPFTDLSQLFSPRWQAKPTFSLPPSRQEALQRLSP